MAEPSVILGRVLRVAPGPGDADEDADAEHTAADFSLRVSAPPRRPYVLAAGPNCVLAHFSVAPFHGMNFAPHPQDSNLVLARQFHRAGGATSCTADRVRVNNRPGAMPVILNLLSVGLASSYDGAYVIAELQVDRGSDRAKLFRFLWNSDQWHEDEVFYPLSAHDREWVPSGVVADGDMKLWWFDLSWGLLSYYSTSTADKLLFHCLPEGRTLDATQPEIHHRRCITVCRGQLRYVEIIPGDGHGIGAATVSLWTRIPTPDGSGETAGWYRAYEMSFAEIWNDDSYKRTGLPVNELPVLAALRPTDPDVVYFALDQHLFGVNVPLHRVVEFVDEPSCRDILPWFLPPQI
ncbi:hypothetical protein ACP70R_047271 [Stipagrostis hirtigluma subsp. patula]